MNSRWLGEVTSRQSASAGLASIDDARVVARESGDNVVAWAAEVGYVMARRMSAVFPELSRNPAQLAVLHRGTTSTVLRCVLIVSGSATEMETAEALEAARDFAHRGVPLPGILQAIQIGHDCISDAFLSAIAESHGVSDRPAEMRRVSSLLFTSMEAFSRAMESEFLTEYETSMAMSAASRLNTVNRLLRDEIDPAAATRSLGYPLNRDHVALVTWIVGERSRSLESVMQATAQRLLISMSCEQHLLVPVGAGVLWAWGIVEDGNRHSANRQDGIPEGVDIAVGEIASGPGGFRTSHQQAAAVENLNATAATPSAGGRILSYSDVETEVLMCADRVAALAFVSKTLGDLSSLDPWTAELRSTLACYLESGRSLNRSAALLHVAKNTVTYRVRRAEELCGRSVDSHHFVLLAALRVHDYVVGQ